MPTLASLTAAAILAAACSAVSLPFMSTLTFTALPPVMPIAMSTVPEAVAAVTAPPPLAVK